VPVVDQFLQVHGNVLEAPWLSDPVDRVHPLRGCHLRPELRNRHLGEVVLHEEKAAVDARFAQARPR
jgi:hypothetical protein